MAKNRGGETLDPLTAEPDPEDSWGHPSPYWDQARQDSASKQVNPLPLLGS